MDVLVLGALHLDVIVDAPRLPALDETLMGTAVAYRFGGKGGNQALAAARMGAKAGMAGRVGRDRFGEQLLAALDAGGVDRTQVLDGPGASGMSVAIVDAHGDYGAVVVSGVNRDIDGRDILLPDGLKVLVLQNEIPEAANLAVAAKAPPSVMVILNAAPARPVSRDLIARADILVVNRVEHEAPLASIAAQGGLPKTIVATKGAEGLVLLEPGLPPVSRPAHAVPVISTHGAGDAFVGALAADLARGATLTEAARFAQAAAALTVSTPPEDRARVTEAAVRAFLAQSPSP